MPADLIQFVDAISASPTVRLNLNDNAPWRCPEFSAPPPRLRRSTALNAMGNGGLPGSSVYDMRTVTMVLDLAGTQDAQASQIQLLARELDRAENFLKYQPNGLTKPVFFRVFRSNITELEDKEARTPKRRLKVELLCQPEALGLREILGPYTVNNDPAAGSNGCYVDLTGVLGDVTVPFLMVDTSSVPSRFHMAVRQHGTPGSLTFFAQAEGLTLGTDTTNPGAGPDAAMSGTGTNNFVRTSFATSASLDTRLTWTMPAGVEQHGIFRILAVVRRSDNTSTIKVKSYASGWDTEDAAPTVTLPLTTNRQLVDLGVMSNETLPMFLGSDARPGPAARNLLLQASRTSGAGTLDWDVVFLIPADESTVMFSNGSELARDATADLVLDGLTSVAAKMPSGSDVFAGDSVYSAAQNQLQLSGRIPSLVPGRTNRLYFLTHDYSATSNPRHTKADTESLTIHYWPAYLTIRPSAT